MKIKELMVEDVITVPSNTPVQESVRLMNKNRIGCLLVVDDGKLNGILTERDILERLVEEGRNPKKTKVSDIMTKHVVFGHPDMELVDATKLMFENKVKKLPIGDRDHLDGLVTLTDIARARVSSRQAIGWFCSKCGTSFTQPIQLTVRIEGSNETYNACPQCFSKASLEDRKIKRTEAPPNASKKRREEKASGIEKKKPFGCVHFLGYLKTRPKGSPIPDECLLCAAIMECMNA